MLILLLMIF